MVVMVIAMMVMINQRAGKSRAERKKRNEEAVCVCVVVEDVCAGHTVLLVLFLWRLRLIARAASDDTVAADADAID